MLTATVLVGFTSSRPVRPDEHTRRVTVSAESETEARLLACQIVACHPEVEMPTSATITDLTL